jgi:hypothetical protein
MEPRLLRFSTDLLPERERFSAFREEFARQILTMDVADLSGGHPRFELSFLGLGAAAVGALIATPAEFVRLNHHLQDGTDDFLFEIIENGPIRASHAGQEHSRDMRQAIFLIRRDRDACWGHAEAASETLRSRRRC